MFQEPTIDESASKVSAKASAKPRVKKSILKIYKSKKPKAESAETAAVPFKATSGGMVVLMEHLNSSTVKLQAELETTRCELNSIIKKLDDKVLDKLLNLTNRQETMEILFEALEGDVESIKRLMQLQLDCLHGIFNAIIFIRSSIPGLGGNVPQNESPNFQPQYPSSEILANPRIAPGPSFSPLSEIPQHQSRANIPAPDAPLHCIYCKRDFTKRSNFNRHCVMIPKYCALIRARKERLVNKYPKRLS